jgi:hypothetical protein
VRREEALIPEPGQLLVELGKHLGEEPLSRVSVWLVKSSVTDAVSLSAVDVSVDGWFFATRPAQSGVVVVEGNDEDRVYSPTTSVRVGLLEELFGGSLAVIDDDNF